jgi:hypothetical protein
MCYECPPNPGYDWCGRCYLTSRGGRGDAGSSSAHARLHGSHAGAAGASAAPPEDATYEQLLAWEEARGTAGPAKGLSGRELSALPERPYLGARDALKGDDSLCAICQCEYEEGEMLCIMPACAHAFHSECIGTWLVGKASCPVCMRDIKRDMREASGGGGDPRL